MTIQQCKYVLEIADTGSFNEAAKNLFVAQSSLSFSVKSLEEELGIKLFSRADNGVYLTEDGREFVRHARRLTEQYSLIIDQFKNDERGEHLCVATQHYDFVADIFGKIMNKSDQSSFRMSLLEMKTYDVIKETETAFCDIGIISINKNESGIMKRYLNKKGLEFTEIRKAKPHIYVRKDHTLAGECRISAEMLEKYPYVSYAQGKHNIPLFAEELFNSSSKKRVEISDRASLMNILLATDSYTVGTGIMPSLLNDGRIVSLPFESNNLYIIGYILRKNITPTKLTTRFIEMLQKELEF